MKWIKCSEKMPPLYKSILIGWFFHDYSEGIEKIEFHWAKGTVKRPFDNNEIYNPNYYTVTRLRKIDDDKYIPYIDILDLEYYWMEIDECKK